MCSEILESTAFRSGGDAPARDFSRSIVVARRSSVAGLRM
jgi:hypothetical protein